MVIPARLQIRYSGDIIAVDVPYEKFLTDFEGRSVEWIHGVVIKMSPANIEHTLWFVFCVVLFETYLSRTGEGRVLTEPMVMHSSPDLPARSPDLQIILTENMDRVKTNEVAGPADLVVEIVSPESHRRDRVEKFGEYEKAGVKEYWILDPIRDERLFYQLGEDGVFKHVSPDDDGYYQSSVLKWLRIPVSIFDKEPIPRGDEAIALVDGMLKD